MRIGCISAWMGLCLMTAGLLPVAGVFTTAAFAQGSLPPAPRVSNQIIIRLRPGAPDPADPGFLKKLSGEAGVGLTFLRPMSGGAYVLRLAHPVTREQLQAAIQALKQDRQVEYAEEDRILHAAGRPGGPS